MYIQQHGQFYDAIDHSLTHVSIDTSEDTQGLTARSWNDLQFEDPFAILSIKFEVRPELGTGEIKIAYDNLGFSNPISEGEPTMGPFDVVQGKKIILQNPWIVPNLNTIRQYKLLKTGQEHPNTSVILTFECVKLKKCGKPPTRSEIRWRDWQKFWINGKTHPLLYKGSVVQEYTLTDGTPEQLFIDARYPYFSIDSLTVFEHYDDENVGNAAVNGSSSVIVEVKNDYGIPGSRLIPRDIHGNNDPYRYPLGGSGEGGLFAPTFAKESDFGHPNGERIINRQFHHYPLTTRPLNSFTNVKFQGLNPINPDQINMSVLAEISFWDDCPEEPKAADDLDAEIRFNKVKYGDDPVMARAREHMKNVKKLAEKADRFERY